MQDLIEEFLADVKNDKAEGTYETRKKDLKAYDEYLEDRGLAVEDVELKDVHKFLRGGDYADATVESRYWSLKVMYDFLAGVWDEMDESPFKDLSPKDYSGNGKSKHTEADLVYVTRDEVDLMAENVTDPKIRNELIIRLLFQTGMRQGELREVKVEDVDLESRSIDVQDVKDPEKHRTVFYQPSLDLLMNQWLDVYRPAFNSAKESPYLFLTNRNEQLGEKLLNEIVRKAAESAGIQEVMYEDAAGNPRHRVTAHALRHGHAVEAVKSDVDIRRLQLHMGHDKIETTQRYLQFKDRDVGDEMKKFGTRAES